MMRLLTGIRRLLDSGRKTDSLKVTAEAITLTTRKGETKCLAWVDLNEVSIYATQYSSSSLCVLWHLKSDLVDLHFQDGTSGSEEALRVIHNLHGFNSILCAHILTACANEPVIVWRKSAG